MIIVKPSYEILTPIDGQSILQFIELCTRTAYKSEAKTGPGSAEKLITSILKRGHESTIEHFSLSVRFICDRGVSHEIVRHRVASYTQESTRYCNYSTEQFGSQISVIEPSYLTPGTTGYEVWRTGCLEAENAYFDLLGRGCTPQEARAVLPTCLKTEIIVTMNLREWRHFFQLRCSKAAHPQIREIATPLLKELSQKIPVIFDDIESEVEKNG